MSEEIIQGRVIENYSAINAMEEFTFLKTTDKEPTAADGLLMGYSEKIRKNTHDSLQALIHSLYLRPCIGQTERDQLIFRAIYTKIHHLGIELLGEVDGEFEEYT